jgi:hypothetical protein
MSWELDRKKKYDENRISHILSNRMNDKKRKGV